MCGAVQRTRVHARNDIAHTTAARSPSRRGLHGRDCCLRAQKVVDKYLYKAYGMVETTCGHGPPPPRPPRVLKVWTFVQDHYDVVRLSWNPIVPALPA